MKKPLSMLRRTTLVTCAVALATTWGMPLHAQSTKPAATCGDGLPDHGKLRAVLQQIVKQGQASNTGLGNHEWASIVNRDGLVCAVAFSGPDRGAQWPGSRVIAAEKASTANALSTPDFALSTGNLWFASQPGQSLFSLVGSAPPNAQAVYSGNPADFGMPNDPLVGKPIGGIIVFGGGLPLYDGHGKLLGGLGLSGDTSCADHVIAWKVRHALALDAVPAGVAIQSTDNLILDVNGSSSPSGYGHPSCRGGKPSDDVIRNLPTQLPVGKKS